MQGLTIGAALAGSYLLGSLPFGLWIAKKWKGVDIRTLGSGNIGSTNVGRVCGPVAGGLVFALDVLKGLVPPLVGAALHLAAPWVILMALLAILGHNYSVWLGFQGGKGIATSLGALLGIAPGVGLTAFCLFGIEVLTLRWVSFGSILGALSLPILMPLFYPGDIYRLGFGLVACLMAIYKHRANIQRLLSRKEPKIHLPWDKKPSTSPASFPHVSPNPPAPTARVGAQRFAPPPSDPTREGGDTSGHVPSQASSPALLEGQFDGAYNLAPSPSLARNERIGLPGGGTSVGRTDPGSGDGGSGESGKQA